MRSTGLLLGFALTLLIPACAHPPERRDGAPTQPAPSDAATQPLPAELAASFPVPVPAPETKESSPVEFSEVLPILERRCTPCHFPGGSMHERLPFEKAWTIRSLGTKLFTRLKDPAEQALISRFLAAPASGDRAGELPSTSPPPAQPGR
jgi:hypothetical protein